MEAAKLKTKKINKGKLKKTIKNVLCRPDSMFWPLVTDEHNTVLEAALSKYKVNIPEYVKPHWKELKLIPKEKRPIAPKIPKVEGLIFGMSQCTDAINNKQCAAVILESTINPRVIVQPLLELCINSQVPVICINNLKLMCSRYFGIPTISLGIKNNSLTELAYKIIELANSYKPPQITLIKTSKLENPMEITQKENLVLPIKVTKTECPYLFRSDKKTRVFIPPYGKISTNIKDFRGQEFIKFTSTSHEQKDKLYMNMMLKRIANNPNRVKKK